MITNLDDYRWLTTAEAELWLTRCASEQNPLHVQTAVLRRELSAERTHLVLEQVGLRERAKAKFIAAERMFFTRTALEQATDQWVAAYKAQRFRAGEPGADLCCGIGGDLLALAACGAAVGVERDPRLAVLAEANCRVVLGAAGQGTACSVAVRDATAWPVDEYAAWHIDPDRRPQGRRTTHVALHEPGDAAIDGLRSRNPAAAIKLAPAAELPHDWIAEAELEWISRARQCRQLVAWFGPLAHAAGLHRATVHSADGSPRTLTGQPHAAPPIADRVGAYVYEPDPAVLAAHLTGALAAEHGLAAVAAECGYLTGDRPLQDSALTCFAITDVLPYQLKRLKQLLRSRRIGRLEIKKRGVPQDPEQLRKALRVPGDASATLLLARLPQGVTAILAQRTLEGN